MRSSVVDYFRKRKFELEKELENYRRSILKQHMESIDIICPQCLKSAHIVFGGRFKWAHHCDLNQWALWSVGEFKIYTILIKEKVILDHKIDSSGDSDGFEFGHNNKGK